MNDLEKMKTGINLAMDEMTEKSQYIVCIKTPIETEESSKVFVGVSGNHGSLIDCISQIVAKTVESQKIMPADCANLLKALNEELAQACARASARVLSDMGPHERAMALGQMLIEMASEGDAAEAEEAET